MNREERRNAERKLKKKQKGQVMKKYNITDKMNFEENPKLQIKDVEVEVISKAKSVLQVLDAETEYEMINKAYEFLFSEEDRKRIDKLDLNVYDFGVFMRSAVRVASGGDIDEKKGEE